MASRALMERARRLAERGRYTVAPNPLVGAVISRDEIPVGEGYHVRAGEAHAEVHAIAAAGSAAHGANMHVTLEPCNHHGRTAPCTDAILRSGISKVVTGHLDPNPRMRGRSVEVLRRAGVEVEVVGDGEFEEQNEQFFHYMRTGRPFVHLKLAMTLDGGIAASGGDSKWITGGAARRQAHLLRAEAGAVLVGAGTVRADDPHLLPRDLPDEPPPVTRAVLDPNLTTLSDARLLKTAKDSPVVFFTGLDVPRDRARTFENQGVDVIPVNTRDDGLDLLEVLAAFGERGIKGLLVEGGGRASAGFLRKGLVNKMTFFYAPKILGSDGVPAVGPLGLERVADAGCYGVSSIETFGDDFAVTLYPKDRLEEDDVHRAG